MLFNLCPVSLERFELELFNKRGKEDIKQYLRMWHVANPSRKAQSLEATRSASNFLTHIVGRRIRLLILTCSQTLLQSPFCIDDMYDSNKKYNEKKEA